MEKMTNESNIYNIPFFNSSHVNFSMATGDLFTYYHRKLPSAYLTYLINTEKVFDRYVTPTLFTNGVLFNVMAIIVTLRTELKMVSPFLFFVSLGIVDTMYLVTEMVHWGSVKVYSINNVAGICQIFYYTHFLTTFLEWWIIVGLLTERVIVLYQPIFARRACNPFRTKCTLITVFIFAMVAHLYHTWTTAVLPKRGKYVCTIIPENGEDIMLLRKVDSVFSFILPSIALIILIVLVIVKMIYLKVVQGNIRSIGGVNITRVGRRRVSCQLPPKHVYLKSFDSKVYTERMRVTIYCVSVAIVFLIICLPRDIIKTKWALSGPTFEEELYLFQLLSKIYSINFAYKGMFYVLAIPEYRKSLLAVCRKHIFSCLQRDKEQAVQRTEV